MKNILIRCDGSKKIGLGHITRSLVLAKQLRDDSYNVIFLLKPFPMAIEMVRINHFKYCLPSDRSFDYTYWIKFAIEKYDPILFIGDIRDQFPPLLIDYMKNKNILTVALDEPSDYAKECDIVFFPPHSKIDPSTFKGKVYQGFEYTLLKEGFYKHYNKIQNTPSKIVVMLGGTDAYNLTLPIVKHLLGLNDRDFTLSVVIRKDHQDYHQLETLDKRVTLYSDIDNMPFFLSSIDYGIVSFGTSVYELLIMKIPFITICLDNDHWISSEFFEKNHLTKRYLKEDIKLDISDFSHIQTLKNQTIQQNKIKEILYEYI